MPKRRKKRRGKRREPQQQMPRPNRGDEPPLRPDVVLPTTVQAEQVVASASLDDNDTAKATDRTVVGNVLEVEREFIWIETEGTRAIIYGSELMLDIGEVPEDRYAPGDRFEAFVFQMGPDPESGAPQFSIRRAAPHLDALNRIEVGSVVANATVVNTYDAGIELDVDGVRGNAFFVDLTLGPDESTHQRYQPGDITSDLLVYEIDNDRGLFLSARRNAPGYVEALSVHSVGDVVSATVVGLPLNGGLWLDVDGVSGGVSPGELPLAEGESAQDRYAIGGLVHDLFVWRVNRGTRHLSLSLRRDAPGYVEAFNAHSVGDVVSATVTGFWSNGGLWLDVGGVIGSVAPDELSLADGESAQERYAVGETIDGLFVWQVNSWVRDLNLSLKRNAPDYVEALQWRAVGEQVSGTITAFEGNGGLFLDVDGLVGLVLSDDLNLADGESAQEHYTVGETIDGLFVWRVDHNARHLCLSLKRNAPGYVEALQRRVIGEVVSGPITSVFFDGLVLDVHGLVGAIPASELQLDAGQSLQQRYLVGKTIAARVWMIDRTSRAILLSAHQHAAGFREEQVERGATIEAVVRGTTPRDVRMPIRVLTMHSDRSVEIPPHALSLSTGMPPRFEDNQTIRVVVVELDDEGRPTRLSHRQALDGWEAEMRRLSHNTVVVPNARPVPPEALSEAERNAGAAAVDLGPITGVIPEDELDRETGQDIATYNETYRVVVESVDDERRIATVSHERFKERWQAVAGQLELEEGAEVEGELRDFDRETALLDLGLGLLAQMPARELPDSDPPGKAEIERIGERFPLRITNFEPGKQTVHVEPRNQWLEALINEPESETLEFKAVLRGRGGEADRVAMTRRSIRTINAFVNTDGGRLIVGVHDKRREVLGLEADEGLLDPHIPKKIDIAFQVLSSNLKRFAARSQLESIDDLVTWRTESVRGKTLLIVECKRGPAHGVDLVVGDDQREFYVRDRDGTHALSEDEDIVDHLRKRAERTTSP